MSITDAERLSGAEKTVFTSDLDKDEHAAVKSGEERGKRVAMADNPERYGMARQKAKGLKAYEKNYVKIFGHN
jgi:hypothetical protein